MSGLISYLPMDQEIGFILVLRTLRVLRPLKAISKWQSMKILLSALGQAVPGVINATAFIAFILFLFAILAVFLFNGQFQQRCRDPTTMLIDPEQTQYCSLKKHGNYN